MRVGDGEEAPGAEGWMRPPARDLMPVDGFDSEPPHHVEEHVIDREHSAASLIIQQASAQRLTQAPRLQLVVPRIVEQA